MTFQKIKEHATKTYKKNLKNEKNWRAVTLFRFLLYKTHGPKLWSFIPTLALEPARRFFRLEQQMLSKYDISASSLLSAQLIPI